MRKIFNSERIEVAGAILFLLIGLSLGVLGIIGIFQGTSSQEVVECNEWQQQAKEYPAFFLAKWQNEQCLYHGIIINAPVK